MAIYLGNQKINVKSNAHEISDDSLKLFFEAGGNCQYSTATSFVDVIPYNATSNLTSMGQFFYYSQNLKEVGLLDTSRVTDMGYMFYNCSSLTAVPQFDTSKVTNMSYMVSGCTSLQTVILDCSSCTNFGGMFRDCTKLTDVYLENVTVENPINIESVFDNCSKLYCEDTFAACKITGRMNYAFRNCYNITGINFVEGDLSAVTSCKDTFKGCSSLVSLVLAGLTVSFDISDSVIENLGELIVLLGTASKGATITFSAANKATVEASEKLLGELTEKGWTIA